ncbi:MAG: DUF871 domain-containing protein [Romboutsia sp.]|uniref:DUF871 domain-containing protein n=1 Tax=Romboutsia sp. TaxID=1965302 RepID=UPI003F40DA8D
MSLGISIYPLQSTLEENEIYIDKSAKLGYKRVFTSMLELNKDKEEALKQVDQYRKLLNRAKNLGMKVFIDVNPEVLKIIEVDPTNLSFFTDLGATGLRLDGVFNGFYEAYITYNTENLDIEINGSFDTGYVNSIVDLGARKEKFLTCHNFYPEEHTGLSLECFEKCHKRHKDLGLNTAAFVTTQLGGDQGPWDINDGLCTLESHRYLPIDVQAQELLALGIDDVIIGDAFATDEELESLAKLDKQIIKLKVSLVNDTYKNIIENRVLQNRWDYSDKIIRDVMSRSEFKKNVIEEEVNEKRTVEAGTLLLNNDSYKRYKGELIVSIDTINIDNRRNILGYIHEDYKMLLKYIQGGVRFVLDTTSN